MELVDKKISHGVFMKSALTTSGTSESPLVSGCK